MSHRNVYVAILLCAGYGTRMGGDTPKPLLEVAGRPVLDYLLDQLRTLPALDTVHVVTNSRHAAAYGRWAADLVERGVLGDLALVLHDDGSTSNAERLGAIGDLDVVLQRIERPAGALVAAGDNILRFSLEPLWRSFLEARESTVLALLEKQAPALAKTAALELAGERVVRLVEKPAADEWTITGATSWACPACYALDADTLDLVSPYLAAGGARDEIGRFIAHAISERPVRALRLEGERLHVGDREALAHASRILAGEAALLDA